MNLLHTAHVPSGQGPFPTILALHGWGASGHDLLGLAPILQGGKALVLCPQGQVSVPIAPGHEGYGWFPLRDGLLPTPEEFLGAAESLRTFLDSAQESYPIDPQRLAVVGFSQGGVMAYELGLRQPERFTGIGALSSWLPPLLLEHLPKNPAQEGKPVLMIHGSEDTVVPVERARQSREAARELGLALTYREFPMGHEIRPEALQLIEQWLTQRAFSDGEASPLG